MTNRAVTEADIAKSRKKSVTSSSTAEYFAKNLQQVGFSSPTKAVLTTLKEAVDNSLDACEDHEILPDIRVEIERLGAGSLKNTDKLRLRVEDNGPGIDIADIPRVFGEYLASSKFGRGRCSRGQQGIGISAATTWALQTTANGVRVISKRKGQKKANRCVVGIDFKNNKGLFIEKDTIDWDPPHGTSVEFIFDGRVQLNGEAGIINYIKGNVLVNPHMTITYKLLDQPEETVKRVSTELVHIPEATSPHPHTMKLGEFMSHGKLFGKQKVGTFLKTGFSRITDQVLQSLVGKEGISKNFFEKACSSLSQDDFSKLFVAIQNAELRAPSTNTVISIGEDGLGKSIRRLGDIDFFSVLSRRPTICDFKPVQVEVAIARLLVSGVDQEEPVQVLRFANRVPLQFDKAGCAIAKAISTVNWRAYGLRQPRGGMPQGPYIIAVSVVSPFIKFRNASKETIDSSDELVEELRRALMQAGQKLSRYLKREHKEAELETKRQYIEQFGPILVEGLVRIVGANDARKRKAEEGLMKILGRDADSTEKELKVAKKQFQHSMENDSGFNYVGGESEESNLDDDEEQLEAGVFDPNSDDDDFSETGEVSKAKGKAKKSKKTKKVKAVESKKAEPKTKTKTKTKTKSGGASRTKKK